MIRPVLASAAQVAALAAGGPSVAVAAPDVPSFAPGACRDAAPALLGLHVSASRRRPDAAAVRRDQAALRALPVVADPALAAALRAVVVAAGYYRIRVDSGTFEPSLARALDAAYAEVERRCVTPPGR